VTDPVAEAFREEWGKVVATLIRVTGDWDLAEECAQEAFAAAVRQWPVEGVPRKPGAWLTTIARHRATDRIRREVVGATKLREVAVIAVTPEPVDTVPLNEAGVGDDRLRLIFTCCHPALAFEAQVALALRTLAGLSMAEIARAFLVTETTMARRVGRAKAKIRNAGIPYRVPPAHLLPERTTAVLGVLYLMFNEGYSTPERRPLCDEAIRLARLLVQLMPDEPEAGGLLALMLLHDSRRHTRLDENGDVVLLADQDRSRWDTTQIAEGRAALDRVTRLGRLGPYQLQAAIADSHAAGSDWPLIARLYAQLAAAVPSPVVRLNHAAAVAMAEGPAAGLALLDGTHIPGYHLLPATRADFLRRLGRHAEAAVAYEQALGLATAEADRRFLAGRLTETRGRAMQPSVIERGEQPYVGIRRTVTMQTIPEIADRMPAVFQWLTERGIEPAGAPFFRYLVIDMAGELVMEAGFPVATPVDGEGEVFADVLPAGRYACVTHIGHPGELMGVTGRLNDWAEAQGLRWDAEQTPGGDKFVCRLEIYKTDPRVQPDMSKWETDLVFKLAD
jgi:RNA polymerase sigma-70 factor (ECF subfamily)